MGNIYHVLVGQLSGLVINFSIGIYSDTINVINVKLCLKVLLIEVYLLMLLSVTLTIFQHHSSVEQFWHLTLCVSKKKKKKSQNSEFIVSVSVTSFLKTCLSSWYYVI